jgi:F-type H+-transporting ATPase subunit b
MVGVGVDISMLIQMVNFLVTLLVLNFLLFRPIRRIVRERKEKIARSEAEIERVRLGAQEKLSMFESQLEQARNEGAGKRLEVRKGAQDEERAVLDKVTKEMEATLERARGEIAGDATKARETLRAQSAAFASAVAEKILGRGVL